MPAALPPALIEQTLRAVARRYHVAAMSAPTRGLEDSDPAAALAAAIEAGRTALTSGAEPRREHQHLFVIALSRLIRDALRDPGGDPVFQAMVLRQQSSQVREHASLSAHAGADRRAVRTAVAAFAHAGKRRRMPAGPLADALADLDGACAAGDWRVLTQGVQALHCALASDEEADAALAGQLEALLRDPALARLRRQDDLASDPQVQRYQSLWQRQGPRTGTAEAAAQGLDARRRGVAVEARAQASIAALAQHLAQAAGETYRVATCLRVPASIPGNADRAKSEWDVALLRQSGGDAADPVWDVCLLVEAKASTDAATTDLPRLLRGLRLLKHADAQTTYVFDSHQGPLRLRGAALAALPADPDELASTILYFSDAPAETAPRLLSAASRMQLLSAQESLDYASQTIAGEAPDSQTLAPLWRQLLAQPRWSPVLNQFPCLQQVRALMVHADDLEAAIARLGQDGVKA
ncbi:3-deoxy-D-arabino-heptulosonate 7-phosphate synthase [Achromobacter mucicolens]|uniref:3-deoxy-D-arabino-heptulosonate 7-phosphate synthase n=1 Tax=Achromobacter mucicolens TaxID=1389922 RepID=UPI0020A2C3DB|nr:3-deoxy-D-arabino-heptulosonate 7-phosphate synthase [Achromobacter mucicolens]MCP2518113.1 3-deoxy-D-arabino-heptulosonate 7-phosphate synthase [Achromobacter mucicolens]